MSNFLHLILDQSLQAVNHTQQKVEKRDSMFSNILNF